MGSLNYAVVQDIDNDGYSELVISSSGGAVYAFDTPAQKPKLRPRSEVQFYSEYRLGAAEYVPPPGSQIPHTYDLILVARHLGHNYGDGHAEGSREWWDCLNTDLNDDGHHNVLDLIICANHLEQYW
jgi:hypothetical protein